MSVYIQDAPQLCERLAPWADAHLLDEATFGRSWMGGPYRFSLIELAETKRLRRRWRRCAAKSYASTWARPLLLKGAALSAFREQRAYHPPRMPYAKETIPA